MTPLAREALHQLHCFLRWCSSEEPPVCSDQLPWAGQGENNAEEEEAGFAEPLKLQPSMGQASQPTGLETKQNEKQSLSV